MEISFLHVLACLFAGIAIIVVLTVKYKVPAFFALLISCFVVGLGFQFSLNKIVSVSSEGFGNIMRSLGLLIALGTTLGIILEYTGSTRVMASFILRKVGEMRAAMAMSMTGFVIGLPIFCDSGYLVLSGLNNSLAKRTGIPMAIMATSLATGLYSIHCMIPPHPGAAAAAGIIGVDLGKFIIAGIGVAIPASIVGYLWAKFAGKNAPVIDKVEGTEVEEYELPSPIKAFLPVAVPIVLIALKSFMIVGSGEENSLFTIFLSLGDPVIALSIGVILAFNCKKNWDKHSVSSLLQDSAEKAGNILIIIGAGGAFGAILTATNLSEHLGSNLPLEHMGLLFPFIVTFGLKTAQGSSTVAIITAASIVLPLLPALGLDSETGKLLCVLAMGAGSMMISHANDSYFWLISKFSGLDMKTMLKVYTLATVFMGLTSLFMIYILSFII